MGMKFVFLFSHNRSGPIFVLFQCSAAVLFLVDVLCDLVFPGRNETGQTPALDQCGSFCCSCTGRGIQPYLCAYCCGRDRTLSEWVDMVQTERTMAEDRCGGFHYDTGLSGMAADSAAADEEGC